MLLACAAWLGAQDIDTVVFETDRKSYRLLDQISDPGERSALEQIFQAKSPDDRLRRAERFIATHGASAFLSVAYDVAAQSCIDLRRPDCAFEHAARSLRILPENPLLLTSLARAQQALGQPSAATASLALEYLDRFAPPAAYSRAAWDALEPKLRETARAAGGLEPERRNSGPSQPAQYAGSAACQGCHAKQHRDHSRTGMAKMFAPYVPGAVFGDFSGAVIEGLRPLLAGGRHYFETAGKRLPVDYTIGSKWQQAYATRVGERIHVFPIQYNRITGRWLNYWREIDPPGSIRHQSTRFTEFSDATLYQRNCAPCHTSQLAQTGPLAKFAEPGVNCEMCHGPSAGHVRERAANKPAHEPPVDFRRLDAASYVKICAQCHRQSAILRRGNGGQLNFSGSSPDFTLPQHSRPFLEFSRRAFYLDGRFRETTFIVEAFERSACYRKGGAHCGTCHDPHPSDFSANLRALQYQDDPDAMCVSCHRGHSTRAHTRHKPDNEASRCVSCHMPRITETVGFKARTHTISDIPDAEAAARFGPAGSPNACLLCHTDKDAAWLRNELSREPRKR